jgi:hypothetical protein
VDQYFREPKLQTQVYQWFIIRTNNMIKFSVLFIFIPGFLFAQFSQTGHRSLKDSEIPIDKPGFYGTSGATYVLTQDIKSDRSGIFLGKDITLDLNGYTLSYADGGYEHIPNSGFEKGTANWDLSKAPGAEVVNTRAVHIV